MPAETAQWRWVRAAGFTLAPLVAVVTARSMRNGRDLTKVIGGANCGVGLWSYQRKKG